MLDICTFGGDSDRSKTATLVSFGIRLGFRKSVRQHALEGDKCLVGILLNRSLVIAAVRLVEQGGGALMRRVLTRP